MTTELAIIDDDLIVSRDLPADQNPAVVYLTGLGGRAADPVKSRRTMEQALETVAGILTNTWREYPPGSGKLVQAGNPYRIDWGRLRYQHTRAVRTRLLEMDSAATAKKKLSALRGVLREAWRLGQMTADEYMRAVDLDLKGIDEDTLPAGRDISSGEIQALLNVCSDDDTAAGARDASIIALLYSCGLRRAELVGLDRQDYNQVAGTLHIKGKGNKHRLAHIVNGAGAALADWLAIRGDGPGALFCPIRKGGHVKTGRLTTQAVYDILQRRATQANVDNVSPHDFRRTFVGDLLDAGADIATVQQLAGHKDVSTTTRYDRRPEEAKRRAVELLHVPYRRREL